MKCAVVILNWNGKHHLERFLPSVISHTKSKIIVADNASTDDSISFLKEHYPQINIIKNEKNYGFALGYSEALKQIQGKYEYYILLNSDVEVTENWDTHLITLLENNKDVAVCQAKILSVNEKDFFEYGGASGGFIDKLGYMFCRGRIFTHQEKDEQQYNTTQEIFWASGACFAIRANLFHQFNGFDADYYAHMEEIDLCWRLKLSGHKIFVEPKSVVYHLGGGSLQYESPFKTYLNFRNNLLLLVKNDASNWLFFKIIFRLKLDGLAGLRFLLQGKFRLMFSIIHAHFGFYKRLPKYLKKRKENLKHTSSKNLVGLYNRSVIWQFFAKGKRKFSELNF
ncbi:MAG: glycosyltransferase family 2 protein [Bacteroidia bacterium]